MHKQCFSIIIRSDVTLKKKSGNTLILSNFKLTLRLRHLVEYDAVTGIKTCRDESCYYRLTMYEKQRGNMKERTKHNS